MTIEVYLMKRNEGKTLKEIQVEKSLSEATVYTLELGYQCYLAELNLEEAIEIIQNS